jgi:hypothetical protein
MTTSSFRALGLPYFGPLAGVAIAIFLWVTSQHSPYAVLDDYRMVAAVKDMRPFIIEGHSETEFNTGRFIPALLFDLVWTGVRSINDLWYVRVLGLLLVAGSVVLYQIWFMGYAKITFPMAKVSIAISSFIVVLLPTVSATTTWAQKTTQLLALPLAMLAGILATSTQVRICRWVAISILIFLSAFSYQHFVTIAVFPLAVAMGIRRSGSLRPEVGRMTVVLGLVFGSLITNVLVVRLIAADVLDRVSQIPLRTRIAEAFEVLAKGAHLFIDKNVLLLGLSASLIIGVTVTALLNNKKSVFVLAGVIFGVGASVAVTLAGDGDSSYRMTFPTQITLWMGLGSLVSYSIQQSDGRRWKLLGLGFLTLISLVLVVENRNTVGNRISEANADDWTNINCHLLSFLPNPVLEEVVARLSPLPVSGNTSVASEVGLLASHIGWIARDQYELAVKSDQRLNHLESVLFTVVDYDQDLPTQTDKVVTVDLQTVCNGVE